MLRKLSYFILLIGLVIYINSCNESTNKANKNKAEEKLTGQFKKYANEMALKYNAISNCEGKIRAINRDIYSIDLEDNLISKESRPVLLNILGVRDIVRINNKYNVLFIAEIADETLLMRLEATPEQVEAIKDHPDIYKEYAAIIAQISSIRNKRYEKNENEWSNWFIADGRCIDLLFFSDIKSP
jgi:hypothetical protein